MLTIYIITGFIIFLILLLCIPVETTILMNTESSKKYSLMVSWLFGMIKKDLVKRKSSQIKKKKSKMKKGLSFRLCIDIVSQFFDYAGFIHPVKDFIFGIFRQLRIKKISGEVIIGLEDPALTGMLFAVIGPANALLNLHQKYDVSINPFFDDENILLGNLKGNVKVQPIRLIYPALKLVVSKEVRQIGNRYIKKKWENDRKKN